MKKKIMLFLFYITFADFSNVSDRKDLTSNFVRQLTHDKDIRPLEAKLGQVKSGRVLKPKDKQRDSLESKSDEIMKDKRSLKEKYFLKSKYTQKEKQKNGITPISKSYNSFEGNSKNRTNKFDYKKQA